MNSYSIVVPMFNCEKTIKRCLDSIFQQTYSFFEVILVDNNCTDSTLKICSNYQNYSNLVIKQCIVQGPSAARNVGIKCAKNDYILFVDSDDYIDRNYLEEVNVLIKEGPLDVIFNGYILENDQFAKILEHKNSFNQYFKRSDFGELILKLIDEDCFGFNCCKLLKTSFVRSSNILFNTEITLHEDALLTCDILEKARTAVFSSIASYHYVKNSDSLSSKIQNNLISNLDVTNDAFFALLDKYCEGRNIKIKVERAAFLCVLVFQYFANSGAKRINEEFCKEYLHSNFFQFLCKFRRSIFSCVSGKRRVILYYLARRPDIKRLQRTYKIYYFMSRKAK